ncbi:MULTISPECIES: peptide chain release factor 1 [Thermotoga]|uniref:Peptide chain release factor 1 n=1 Tax=Thermotoga neapolitana (strain ATCC 49049 / DSM 4359 / NBRC 107923 / NS-E) TaxID=309803 RepID=B9K8X1_THENN|nr:MULTISPECIES: peptide chain release factor 1 [Thermotoga]MDK2785876.1 peptide chain release factor 1 [Thermotoga sp.]HBF11257.1 peptide chain release factor 1 [Thermotoga neapolitana]ACM23404.1 Peptide chain release factor 1 [Thermotoga neapolitana DSM 4359]AJG41314.1 peptide chain release factor 1 [Thermotoga sp. RQ7]KFZ21535.1 peptide chain release factor 1 [Thermotoga neapolitana LA10]
MEKISSVLKEKKKELEKQLSRPDLSPEEMKNYGIEYAKLEEIESVVNRIRETQEFIELLKEEEEDEQEIDRYEKELDSLFQELFLLLSPETGDKAIVEIRPGTGGEEAALFARDLFRMYTRYAERKGWDVEIAEMHETDLGGVKEAVFFVKGKNAYSILKYESGVHRVQRVPITESGGRIHTSTATVVVLPEIEERDIEIRPEDLKIETFRASGHGGQYVNKTESAVRITHIPTGIVVSCQNERSQYQNKQTALRILRARLYQLQREQLEKELSQKRKSQIGTGERSEKIRTYNFPQNRVTDHRINYTSYRLQEILDGDLDEIIAKLIEHDIENNIEEILGTSVPSAEH